MKQFLIFIFSMFITSSLTFADDVIPCANGAGHIITGAISGRQYCKSNSTVGNWWNAVSWCDAQGKELFSLAECECSDTISDCFGNRCPEITEPAWIWTSTVSGSAHAYLIGNSATAVFTRNDPYRHSVLCK